MQQLRIFLVAVFLTLACTIYGQIDPQICPNGPTSITDPRWPGIPSRFEIVTELISGNEMIELSQAFTTERDTVATSSRRG